MKVQDSPVIKNLDELLSHGNVEGKKAALEIIEYTLMRLDSYNIVKGLMALHNDELKIGDVSFDLSRINDIYVIGAGKSTLRIAEALEEVLKDRIKGGVIIEKYGAGKQLSRIEVIEAGHPIPDEKGLEGAEKIVQIARSAKENDLVFVAITGGCSALMCLPAKGIPFQDKQRVNELLLKCGATIDEINTVRKHISSVKGGRLALLIHPAHIINLIVIDEVAGKPWGPTIPDTTTFRDAELVLKRYDLWDKVPESVRRHISEANPKMETPKIDHFRKIGIKSHTFILADNKAACEIAYEKAKKLGFNSTILSTVIEGESKDVGIVLAAIAKEACDHGRPLNPPCALICGGETTVTIRGEAGEGGRNQELVLSASLKISGKKEIVIASVGTDGTDGPTDIAGGIIDGSTLERAEKTGINVTEELKRHNSSYVLKKLGDAIMTGPTGTNVMDLQVIIVTSRKENINHK